MSDESSPRLSSPAAPLSVRASDNLIPVDKYLFADIDDACLADLVRLRIEIMAPRVKWGLLGAISYFALWLGASLAAMAFGTLAIALAVTFIPLPLLLLLALLTAAGDQAMLSKRLGIHRPLVGRLLDKVVLPAERNLSSERQSDFRALLDEARPRLYALQKEEERAAPNRSGRLP